MNTRQKSAILIFVFCLSLCAAFAGYRFISYAHRQGVILANRKAAWVELKNELNSEVGSYKGKAGIVVKDLRTGWKVSFNEDQSFPSASLVKIPIMAASFKAAQEGKINLDDSMILKGSYKVPGSGILKNVPAGTPVKVSRLMELMVTESDNTAANMLIDLLGFNYINDYSRHLGLEETNLSRKMMDFRHRRRGVENYTTPEDMAYILEKIYRKQLLNDGASQECLNLLICQRYNDRLPAKLPIGTKVAHKTGLERNVCHDVGIIFAQKGDLIVCVLTKHLSTSRQSKEFIAKVALSAYNYSQKI
ncbi:MAG: class A beta-lactamase-related serine hydrolase [Candidatus Omnitrophica bacterium]|nr:class A beta-lactamase-related serine hydrolase [Candidatus Omnitrophota bacterium]